MRNRLQINLGIKWYIPYSIVIGMRAGLKESQMNRLVEKVDGLRFPICRSSPREQSLETAPRKCNQKKIKEVYGCL